MLHHIPPYVPPLAELVEQLGRPSAVDLARALGVTPRTVFRWYADDAPRVARLAVFWITPAGWSAHTSEAARQLADWRALADARARECDTLRARIARLESLGDFGTANAPLWRDERREARQQAIANDARAQLGVGVHVVREPLG